MVVKCNFSFIFKGIEKGDNWFFTYDVIQDNGIIDSKM